MQLEKETDGEKFLGVYKWKGVSVPPEITLYTHLYVCIFMFSAGLKKIIIKNKVDMMCNSNLVFGCNHSGILGFYY